MADPAEQVPRLQLQSRYYRMYPSLSDPHGEAFLDLDWDRSATALLLVDVYGQPDGTGTAPTDLTPASAEIISRGLPPLIAGFREAGMPVVYVQNRLAPWLERENVWRTLSERTCGVDVLATWADPDDVLAYDDRVAPLPGDLVVDKQMYSGFFRTDLEERLRERGIRHLVLAGFDSRLCLAQTAIDAMYRDFDVVVVRDRVATFEFPETAADGVANFLAIRTIETSVGTTVLASDVLEALDRKSPW